MIKKLYTQSIEKEYEDWNNLLQKEGIKSEATIDESFGIYEDETLIATASRYQNVIKCVAIDSQYQGGEIFNKIISHLMTRNSECGYFKHYVYTKPESKKAFEYLGFKTIESVDNTLVFMENAINGFPSFIKKLESKKVKEDKIAAIVMNANPFTKGHQYLIEKASSENDHLFVFVLSEEMSVFSFKRRKELVIKGTAHLNNITVCGTENYMVSNTTFPSYFLEESLQTTQIQARLDARIFANHIAKVLNIKTRYVGSEPFSKATNIYNEALTQEFENKLSLRIVERLQNEHEDIISATKVRHLLINEDFESLKQYVPISTYEFLKTSEGKSIIEKLKEQPHEHP